jgi:DNA-binding transcriptional regulator YbjK
MTKPYWRRQQKNKPRRDPAEIVRERDARRTAALAKCIKEINGDTEAHGLTHSFVAERVGIPVQYVRWKYPSIEHLLALADASR